MDEHRPKKLLDQARACPEPGEGMPSASNTIRMHGQAYVGSIRRYIHFHGVHSSTDTGKPSSRHTSRIRRDALDLRSPAW